MCGTGSYSRYASPHRVRELLGHSYSSHKACTLWFAGVAENCVTPCHRTALWHHGIASLTLSSALYSFCKRVTHCLFAMCPQLLWWHALRGRKGMFVGNSFKLKRLQSWRVLRCCADALARRQRQGSKQLSWIVRSPSCSIGYYLDQGHDKS